MHHQLDLIGKVGPPATLLTALFVWAGYVATLQRFRYFGVYLELADLPTQDLILYGVETAYPIVLALLLAALGGLVLHTALSRVTAWRPRWSRPASAGAVAAAGVAMLARGLTGVLRPALAERETPGVTPLCLALGVPALVYAYWLLGRPLGDRFGQARLIAAGIGIVGLFWAVSSFAGESGVARGLEDARRLHTLPEVVIYSKRPIPDLPAVTAHDDFGADAGHRHRYRGLRLLLESGGRLFLVPLTWRPGDDRAAISTFVIPYDKDIRLQLLPAARPGGQP
ncbi:hypothetical protein [Nonomuraea candida]|uniref:hypothetical protein n=1 Tax=Nonomuraea candida TaxID=359159 RepID=UPI000694DFF1|nr:hypothetical protein [Nonomuraea candida]